MDKLPVVDIAKPVLKVECCGGIGCTYGSKLQPQLADQIGVRFHFVDTVRPNGVPASAFTAIRPDHLADDPGPRLLALLRDADLSPTKYRDWKIHSGEAGVSRLPSLAYLAALNQLDELQQAHESVFRALTASARG